jgi:ribonuclease-3
LRSFFKKVSEIFFPPAESGNLIQIQKVIGYGFKNTAFLKQSLTHRSFAHANDGTGLNSNERLEFLGDAVLDLIVSEHLYNMYTRKREGMLSQYKSLIISRRVLRNAAEKIKLGSFMRLSEAEEKSGGRDRASILSDAFEAVIAAIYLDGGYDPARRFVREYVLDGMEVLLKDKEFFNFKSILLEHFQGLGEQVPRYVILEESGPDHNKTFQLGVEVDKKQLGTGEGKTKKDAEQNAARSALEGLGILSGDDELQ